MKIKKQIFFIIKYIYNMKNRWLVILLVVLVAGFFRVYKIDSVPPGLYPDEAINGNNAIQAIEPGTFKLFYPENNGREGLFINVQALFVGFLGN